MAPTSHTKAQKKYNAILLMVTRIKEGKRRFEILREIEDKTGLSNSSAVKYYSEAFLIYKQDSKIELDQSKPLDIQVTKRLSKELQLKEALQILTEIARNTLSRPDEKIKAIDKIGKYQSWENKLEISKAKRTEKIDVKALDSLTTEQRALFLQTIRTLNENKETDNISDAQIVE